MTTREELGRLVAEQEKKLREAKRVLRGQASASIDERQAQRELMARKRSEARDLVLDPPADVKRRRRALRDVFHFLSTYFPLVFYQDFTPDRRAMAQSILHAASFSGDYALAGPRGEGKTRLALYCALFLLLAGRARFPLIISKNQAKANLELAGLKNQLSYNDLLAADFPEICMPIRALEGWASRARLQTVAGQPTRIEWGASAIILPTVPAAALPKDWPKRTPSCARGQTLASYGVEGPIRGTVYRDTRPDLAILDDIDDRESAASQTQTAARERIIEQDIAGLAGPGLRISRVMLCTVINRHCIAAKYTDRREKAGWRGQRYKAIQRLPEAAEFWEQYIELRRTRDPDKDPDARAAHKLYQRERAVMDAGALVANAANFECKLLADGEPAELSALQHAYNLVADIGWDNYATEYQNDPPADEEVETSEITSALVRSRTSGLEHREVPRDCAALVAFLDLGHSYCHYTVTAWRKQAIGNVVDHGILHVHDILKESSAGQIEKALHRALWDWHAGINATPYRTSDGELRAVDLALIDSGSGLHQPAVYQFCREAGPPFAPAKGWGATFQHGKSSRERIVGDNWYRSWLADARLWIYHTNVDFWKRWCQERFLAPTLDEGGRFRPGTLSLFACPPSEQFTKDRREFSHQMVAEIWVRRQQIGKPIKEGWEIRSHKNHWLDATTGTCVAGSICGVRLLGEARQQIAPEKRPSLSQLAGRKT